MSANNSDQNQTNSQNWVFVGTYSLVFVSGLTLNLIALVVFTRHNKARSHTTVYMTNLALADLLLVCTLPIRIYYHTGALKLSQWLCEMMGLVLLINMYGSIFLLACMNFDRCVAVCFPLSQCVKDWRKRAPLVCLGVWVLTIGASLPNYLRRNNSEVNCFNSRPVYATKPAAVASALTIGFGIPLLSMLVCSWGLVRAINRSAAVQMELVDSKKIKRMVTANLVIFLLCFFPYHLMLLLLHFDKKEDSSSLLLAYQYSLMVACLNAMLDPLVYYFTTETFRNRVQGMETLGRAWAINSNSSDGQNRSRVPLNA
ncbi:lysophosphatidic acid receptor 4 [Amia ocellicauda]|uniref:lysophosphatidic acid receptor 4 n=1 Tax=Amia ocellicauda TaxID=2972642 RepID=UPI0034640292|nr:LPAR6 protein [Amia calva]